MQKELIKLSDEDRYLINFLGKAIVNPKPRKFGLKKTADYVPKSVDELRLEAVYLLDPTVRGAIDLISKMVLSYGYYFEGKRKIVEKLKDWEEYVNLKTVLEFVIKDALIYGNAYIEKAFEGRKLTGDSWGIKELKIIHPATMFVDADEVGNVKGYYQNIADVYVSKVGTTIEDLLNTKGVKLVSFEPTKIAHYRYNCFTNLAYGTSALETIIDFVNIKFGLIDDLSVAISKVANPVRAWRVGEEGKPVSNTLIMQAKEMLAAQSKDLDIVVPHFVQPEDISLARQSFDIDRFIDLINDEILRALNVPSNLFGGSSSSSGSTADSQVRLESFVRMLKSFQKDLSVFVRRNILVHLVYGERDPLTLTPSEWAKVPRLRWREIESVADLRLRMESLTKNGIIGVSEAREMIGLPPEYDPSDFNPQNILYLARAKEARNKPTGSSDPAENLKK